MDRQPLQQAEHGGSGYGETAVRVVDRPRPDRDRADDELLEPQGGEPRADAHHVGNRVPRPYLVEVDIPDVHAVYPPFDLG